MSTDQILIAQFLFPSTFPTDLVEYPESTGKNLEVFGGTDASTRPVPIYERGLYFDGTGDTMNIDVSANEDVYADGPYLSHSYTIVFVFHPLDTNFNHKLIRKFEDGNEKTLITIQNDYHVRCDLDNTSQGNNETISKSNAFTAGNY